MHSPDLTVCERLADAVLARRTTEGYTTDFRLYRDWCRNAGREDLPSTAETISLYLAECLTERKVKTVRRYLCAILHQHRQHGHNPPDVHKARAMIRGAQRLRGEWPAQKAAISVGQLRGMIQRLDRPEPYRTRDRAVLLFGFATALRRASITGTRIGDVQFTEQGMTVHVLHEKQDRNGTGRSTGIPYAKDPEICAAIAVKKWLTLRGNEPGYLFDGLWHGQRRPQDRMNDGTVANIVKRAVESIGLDPARYGGHSLRAGFVTTALESGVGEILTARHTGHRSLTTLRMYLRPEDPFRGNACSMIGF